MKVKMKKRVIICQLKDVVNKINRKIMILRMISTKKKKRHQAKSMKIEKLFKLKPMTELLS